MVIVTQCFNVFRKAPRVATEASAAAMTLCEPPQEQVVSPKQPAVREATGLKYTEVWHRLRAKLRSQRMLWRLGIEVQLFGTSSFSAPADNADIVSQIMNRRLTQEVAKKEEKLLFAPSSAFMSAWSALYVLLMLYTAFVFPCTMAFRDMTSADAWYWVNLAVDVLFLLDIAVKLNSEYFNEAGELVSSRKVIFLSYLKSWLIIDLFASLPYYAFQQEDEPEEPENWASSEYKSLVRLLRLPYVYRLLRLTRVFTFAQRYQNNKFVLKVIENVCAKSSVLRLIAFVLMMTVCIHLMTCLWYFAARVEDFSPSSWVVQRGLRDAPLSQLYLASLFWTITTLTTVGYGDIVPGTSLERILATAWMIFGVFFYSVTVGSLAAMLGSSDSKDSALTAKLAAVDEFAAEAKLDKDLCFRLRNALRHSIEKSGFSAADKRMIFNELPKQLRYEVARAMHGGAVATVSFFAQRDQVFVAAIVPFLTTKSVGEDQIVYKENEDADEVYFISRGRCKVIYQERFEIRKLPSGSYFGEVELIQQVPRKFTVTAATNTDLLSMTKSIFYVIKTDFPSVYSEMKSVAAARDELNERAKANMQALLSKSRQRDSLIAPSPAARGRFSLSAEHKVKERRKSLHADDDLGRVERVVAATQKLAANILTVLTVAEKAATDLRLPPELSLQSDIVMSERELHR